MKGILLKTPMVIATKEDRKNQTRRMQGLETINEDPKVWEFKGFMTFDDDIQYASFLLATPVFIKPRYQPGEIIYVKETYTILEPEHVIGGMKNRFVYKADMTPEGEEIRKEYIKQGYPYQWKSAMFMPEKYARMFLEVTNVRVERLGDISESDAIAEGIRLLNIPSYNGKQAYENYVRGSAHYCTNAIDSYKSLWQSINGSYNPNTWVFVYDFKRIEKPNNQ